jgi:hypothetical protein
MIDYCPNAFCEFLEIELLRLLCVVLVEQLVRGVALWVFESILTESGQKQILAFHLRYLGIV